MIFQSGEFINILIIVMFSGSILLAWFLLCLFKYKKWHDRKLNCTKKLVAHVVEIRERKTARRNILLGAVNIRHCLNDYLLKYGGHIGDGIRPSERGKGYATNRILLLRKPLQKTEEY